MIKLNRMVSVGRLFACFALQAGGSPLVDAASVIEKEGEKRRGYGLLFRLPFTGHRPTVGLVVGWLYPWMTKP